jgi:hypothetical protein
MDVGDEPDLDTGLFVCVVQRPPLGVHRTMSDVTCCHDDDIHPIVTHRLVVRSNPALGRLRSVEQGVNQAFNYKPSGSTYYTLSIIFHPSKLIVAIQKANGFIVIILNVNAHFTIHDNVHNG